jgi:hypothetical protein
MRYSCIGNTEEGASYKSQKRVELVYLSSAKTNIMLCSFKININIEITVHTSGKQGRILSIIMLSPIPIQEFYPPDPVHLPFTDNSVLA